MDLPRGAAGAPRCAAGRRAGPPASGWRSCGRLSQTWLGARSPPPPGPRRCGRRSRLAGRPGAAAAAGRPRRPGRGRCRRALRRRTTTRRRSAGGRPRRRAWRGRTGRTPRCPGRARRRRCGPALAEEHREHRARPLDAVRHTGIRQCGGRRVGDGVRRLAEPGVEGVVAGQQRGEPGGGRDGVPREGPGLVDGPVGGEQRHDVGAATEGRGREAAAHDLAEGHEVGGDVDALVAPPAGAAARGSRSSPRRRRAARRARSVTRRRAAVKPGWGGTTPMLPAAASVMTHGDLLAACGEDGLERLDVVVGHDERLGGHLGRHARRSPAGPGWRRPSRRSTRSESTWPW